MRISSIAALVASLLLSGCAADQLTQNSLRTIDTFGTTEQRLVLANLSRFIDNPYTIPGHADFTSGVFQSSTSIALSGKFPLMNLSSQTREIDVAMASSGDTDNWTLTPVTDAQDLRRLRAVYSYAVCGNREQLEADWIAASGVPLPLGRARTIAMPAGRWSFFSQRDPSTPPKAAAKPSVPQPGKKPGGGGGGGGKAGDDPSPGLARQAALAQILGLLPQGRQWLYWTGTPRGELPGEPPCAFPPDTPPPPGAFKLGTYGGHELWTTNRQAFSDFVLVVLASLPNTVGYPAVVGPGGVAFAPAPKTVLSNPLGRIGTIR